MKQSNFDLEKKLLEQGYGLIIGVDEAGRGPLAGPVVACAVMHKDLQFVFSCLREKDISNQKSQIANYNLIRDSKSLSEKQREKLFDFIIKNFYVGVGLCDQKTIDRINILEATFLAMKKAYTALENNMKRSTWKMENNIVILVDGNKKIPNFSKEQKAIINGDKIIKSISAASIIAKVTRDRIMRELHKKYPMYKFDKHKGYGTKFHVEMLQKHGPCKVHRKTFEPVKSLVKRYK